MVLLLLLLLLYVGQADVFQTSCTPATHPETRPRMMTPYTPPPLRPVRRPRMMTPYPPPERPRRRRRKQRWASKLVSRLSSPFIIALAESNVAAGAPPKSLPFLDQVTKPNYELDGKSRRSTQTDSPEWAGQRPICWPTVGIVQGLWRAALEERRLDTKQAMDVIRVIWAAWLLLFKRPAHPTGPLVFYLSVFPVCLVALSALFALFAVFASPALFALCCIAPSSVFASFADT